MIPQGREQARWTKSSIPMIRGCEGTGIAIFERALSEDQLDRGGRPVHRIQVFRRASQAIPEPL